MVLKTLVSENAVNEKFLESLYELPDGKKFRTCIQCGTCAGICPFGPWMEYSPRQIINALRMNEFDEILQTNTAWMCVSCLACSEFCPQGIPLTDGLMSRLKEEALLAGNVPEELQVALENSHRYGNPMGESPRKRADWSKGLKPEVPIMAKIKRPVDVLWYVGDYSSYHPVVQGVSIALVSLLNNLGIDFAILGPEEVSDGDSQRLAGESGLFEYLAHKNAKSFEKYQFGTIMTTDPHAYNAIKNEYPALGIEYPIQHYTEFLVGYLDEIKKLTHEIEASVTFHDPCYLGRANGIYDAPRELIEAIPGVNLVEMSHSRTNSLCCGGGGGGMWLDGFQWDIANTRLSDWRVSEAVMKKPLEEIVFVLRSKTNGRKKTKGAPPPEPEKQILIVACPYEKPRFQDAAKTVEGGSEVIVMDIAELLLESMQLA